MNQKVVVLENDLYGCFWLNFAYVGVPLSPSKKVDKQVVNRLYNMNNQLTIEEINGVPW